MNFDPITYDAVSQTRADLAAKKTYARRIVHVLASRTWTSSANGVLFIRVGGAGGNGYGGGYGGGGGNGGTVGIKTVKCKLGDVFNIIIPAAGSGASLMVTGPGVAITVPAGSSGRAAGAGNPPANPTPTGLDSYIKGGLGGAATTTNVFSYGGGGAAAMLGVAYNGGNGTGYTAGTISNYAYGGGAGVGGNGADGTSTESDFVVGYGGGAGGPGAINYSINNSVPNNNALDQSGSTSNPFDNSESCILLVACAAAGATNNRAAGPGGGGSLSMTTNMDSGFGGGSAGLGKGGICGGGGGNRGQGGQGMATLEFYEELPQ